MTSSEYWWKLKLPYEFDDMTMSQLNALRRIVQQAFNAGKKTA